MNGVSLARAALKLNPNLQVLLTTGWADRALDMSQDGNQNEFAVLGKPYLPASLAQAVREKLDKKLTDSKNVTDCES